MVHFDGSFLCLNRSNFERVYCNRMQLCSEVNTIKKGLLDALNSQGFFKQDRRSLKCWMTLIDVIVRATPFDKMDDFVHPVTTGWMTSTDQVMSNTMFFSGCKLERTFSNLFLTFLPFDNYSLRIQQFLLRSSRRDEHLEDFDRFRKKC